MRRPIALRRPWPLACAAVAALALAACARGAGLGAPAGLPAAAPGETVVVDGRAVGRRFDGLGGVSSGGSSRLLFDYPEPARGQILDYLFRPGYGAALQLLKVEIGGEVNGTVGSEPSHMRERGQVRCDRGYEWWLMQEARKRNPRIKLVGLEWGTPGWFDGGVWSADNIDYIARWIDCAKANGVPVDYVGGWNESGFNAPWYVAYARALRQSHPEVQIIAADNAHTGQWNVATAMARDSAFAASADVVGVHGPGGSRVDPDYLHVISSDAARALGKPLWASELSSLSHDVGAIPLARTFNRAYIDARVTGQMIWTPISAWYATLPIADTGPIVAEWPWSGYYDVGGGVWALAHTTQFTAPGWHYLDRGSQRLASGATIASLAAPDGRDYTMVVEAMDVKAPTTLAIRVEGLPSRALQLWETDLGSSDPARHFRHVGAATRRDGVVTLLLEPRRLYTLTTITTGGRGTARAPSSAAATLALPYRESFDAVGGGKLARFFSDVSGLFETAPCSAGRGGVCYRQMVARQPNDWHGPDMPPTTIAGDPRWWGDYRVSSAVLVPAGASIELLGRVDGVGGDEFLSGYHLQLASDGAWRLYTEDIAGTDSTLGEGRVTFDAARWHDVALEFRGAEIIATIDGARVASVRDDRHRLGQIGLRASKWAAAEFDDVQVVATAPAPTFLPHAAMRATATSEHAGNAYGYAYPAASAIDDRPETYWRSEWEPPARAPQAITLDLGAEHDVRALVYRPRISGHWAAKNPGNAIGRYDVQVSTDGQTFTKVASGSWRGTPAAVSVASLGAQRARYVRLQGLARPLACETSITASEIDVSTTPIADPSPNVPAIPHELDVLLPRAQLTVRAPDGTPAADGGRAIDGDCATTATLAGTGRTRAITLDLGGRYDVAGLAYLPPQDAEATGAVADYAVLVSDDGEHFTRVTSGRWATDGSAQFATWPQHAARYLRLEATTDAKTPLAAAELHVGTIR